MKGAIYVKMFTVNSLPQENNTKFGKTFMSKPLLPYHKNNPADHLQPINKIGVLELYKKEIFRFLKVYQQTITSPVISTLIFFIIFKISFGEHKSFIEGVPFETFLAPGLIMMAMIQNSFANSSSSLIIAKMQGSITDLLVTPLSTGEIIFAYILAAITRGCLVFLCLFPVFWYIADIPFPNIPILMIFSLLSTYFLGALGFFSAIFAKKFDEIAFMTNFVVAPLSLLSGTFYSIHALPPWIQTLTDFNPFYYMINGFRHAFIHHMPSQSLWIGIFFIAILNILLTIAIYFYFSRTPHIRP